MMCFIPHTMFGLIIYFNDFMFPILFWDKDAMTIGTFHLYTVSLSN